jgi:hypothetical protein
MRKSALPLYWPLCLVAVGLLSACSGPRIAPNTGRTTYLSELYQYGAGDRDLALEVRGNPFAPADKPALDALIERAADQSGILRPPTHPRLQPGDSAMSNYRLVVLFSRSGGVTGQGLCDGYPDKPGNPSNEVTVTMAFCISGRAASEATGWISPSSISDPDLPLLIKQMELELFRPDNSLDGSGGNSQ